MTGFLIRRFVRNPEDTENAGVRYAYGRLAGITGLCANILLFAAKLIAGGSPAASPSWPTRSTTSRTPVPPL
ncbi:MAG: hypothetical protein ACLSS9_14970 [Acutalibacteraceae bacterium]